MTYSQTVTELSTPRSLNLPPELGEESTLHRPQQEGQLAADRAYQAIKWGILNLKYPPGSAIKDTELMQSLGLGRTPIREAIKKLEVEMLVVSQPRQGTYVSQISLADFGHLYQIRRQLTDLAVSLAVKHRGSGELPRLRKQVERLPGLMPRAPRTVIRSLLRFEYQLGALSGNHYLKRMLERSCGYTQRVWLLVAEELTAEDLQLKEYVNLVGQMERGKIRTAREVMIRHLDIVHENVLNYF